MTGKFSEIEAFVSVAESGGFSAAADRLQVGKSAVSRRVADLEARLGVQLFHRTTRRVALTDTGREYYDRCVRVLQDLEDAEQAASQAHGALRGRLRAALPVSFGLRHLSPAICAFQQLHPAVDFDLDFNDRHVDLLEEGFDLAVRIGRLEDSTLIARRLVTIRTVVCASPDYLHQHGTPELPEQLSEHAALVYSNVPSPETWSYWDAAGRRHQVKVPVRLRSNNGDFIVAAARAGHGVIISPTFIAGDAIASGELVPILTGVSWPRSSCYAVYPPTRHLTRRVRVFIDFIAQRFAGVPYWDEKIPG
jgi:DNA-binding transcriptional LysR family regulator